MEASSPPPPSAEGRTTVFIDGSRVGDGFTPAGRPARLERVGIMERQVTRADAATLTVPRWDTNKLPLTHRVAGEIRAFRSEPRARPDFRERPATLILGISQRIDCGTPNAAIIPRVHAVQHGISEIPIPAIATPPSTPSSGDPQMTLCLASSG